MRIDDPIFSGSVVGSDAVASLSGSFTGSGTIENSVTASKLRFSASFGLGIENTFDYDGSTNQVINLDTASAHFITGSIKAIAGSTGSFVTTASISGLTQSFTKGDGSTFEINLPDTGSVDLLYSMSNGLGIEAFTFENVANALVQVDTSSAHVAGLTGSLLATSSLTSTTMSFTKGDGTTYNLNLPVGDTSSLLITASFTNQTMSFTKGNGSTFDVAITDTSSFVTTASISGLTQSFTKGDGSTFEINLPDTGSVDLLFEITGGKGVDPFTFDNTANAEVQVNTASFHIANLTASLVQTSSISGLTQSFTKGDGSTYTNLLPDTGSFITTASYSTGSIGGTVNTMSFTKGDGTTFGVHISNSVVAVTPSTVNNLIAARYEDGTTVSAQIFTSSYAFTSSVSDVATSSSFATTASFVQSASFATTSSHAITASFVQSASFATTSSHAITASYVESSSFATTSSHAITASYVESSSFAVTSSHAITASFVTSASFATTSSHAITASYVESSSYAVTSSHAITASYVESSSFAITSSHAITASYVESSSFAITSSHAVTSSHAITASYVESSSFATTSSHAITASYVESSSYAITSSHAITASYVESSSYATTSSHAITASYVESSSYAVTSSHAITASYVESSSYAVTSSHAITASYVESSSFATTSSHAITASYVESSSYAVTSSHAITASFVFSASHAEFADDARSASLAQTASFATKVSKSVSQGSGIEAFSYNGSTAATVQLDTASAHFTQGASASLSTIITNVSASAAADISTNSASIALLSSSVVISASTSSTRPIDTITFTKGDGTTFDVTQDTSSFVKTVNGIAPNATTGNVAVALTSVETGTSSSMLAYSSSGNFNEGDVWVISGESGSALTGSNGKAFIFDSGSGQLLEISNLDVAENDARYVNLTGDTMTGRLVLSGNPTINLHAATKQYVDPAFVTASVSTGSDGSHTLTFTRLGGGTDVISLASSSWAATASYVESSSFATTSSHAITASYVESSSFAVTSSHAITASYVESSSYAVTSSHSITASYAVTSTSASYLSQADGKRIESTTGPGENYIELKQGAGDLELAARDNIILNMDTNAGGVGTIQFKVNGVVSASIDQDGTGSFNWVDSTASYANQTRHSLTTASANAGIIGFEFDGSTAQTVAIDTASAIFKAGVEGAISGISGSYTGSFTGSLLGTASKIENPLTSSLGIVPFEYTGEALTSVALDTSSAHFISGVSSSIAGFTGSYSGSFTGSVLGDLTGTASFATKVGFALSGGLGVETFTYDGSARAHVQVDTSSAHFASGVSASVLTFFGGYSGSFTGSLLGTASIVQGSASNGVAIAPFTYDGSKNVLVSVDTASQAFADGVALGLSSASFAGLSINFSGSNLNFSQSNLSGSTFNFSGSSLDFSGATLNLSGSTWNWSGSSLDFTGANFTGSWDFSGVTASNGLYSGGSYSGSFNYSNAHITGGFFTGSAFVGASFTGSSAFTGSFDFSNATVTGISVNYAPTTQSANFTAVAGLAYIVTQSSAVVTVTLPASPANGDSIKLANMDDRATILGRNGNKIMGLAEDMTLNVEQVSFELMYESTSMGWVIYGARAIT